MYRLVDFSTLSHAQSFVREAKRRGWAVSSIWENDMSDRCSDGSFAHQFPFTVSTNCPFNF